MNSKLNANFPFLLILIVYFYRLVLLLSSCLFEIYASFNAR